MIRWLFEWLSRRDRDVVLALPSRSTDVAREVAKALDATVGACGPVAGPVDGEVADVVVGRVNGAVVWRGGRSTGLRPGRVLAREAQAVAA